MDQIIPIRNGVFEALWAGGSVGKKLFSFWLSLAVFINNFIVKENLLKRLVRIVWLVNTLDDLYQAVVLDNP